MKKVRKFPDFQVDTSPEIDKMTVKRNMDKVFQMMKELGVDEIPGVERSAVERSRIYAVINEHALKGDGWIPWIIS